MNFNLQFWIIAAVRFLQIFFNTSKNIRLKNLEIDKKDTLGKIVVRFRFENAIWVQISGGSKTMNNKIVLSAGDASITGKYLLVQGFFQQKFYSLSAFDSEPWKLKLFPPIMSNIKNIHSISYKIKVITPSLSIQQKLVSHQQYSIKINHSTFSNIDLI